MELFVNWHGISINPDPNQLDNFFLPPKRAAPERKRQSKRKVKLGIITWLTKFLPTRDQFSHLPKLLSVRERYSILALAAVALAALLTIPIGAYFHFTIPGPDFGGSFVEGMVGAPKTINPLLAQTSDVDRDLSKIVYAGLMKNDSNGRLVPDLAESYDISGDGLIYTFKLRDGLKWHNGSSLTADDVVFTILTAQNSDYGSFQRISWQGVEVDKVDDRTVSFKLKNKYAQFLSNTTLGILPKHLWENVKPASFGLAELNIKPVGAGPYKFYKIRRDGSGNVSSMEFRAFENYYNGKPYISKISFKFYASEDKMINGFNQNEIDGFSFISPQKKSSVRFLGKLNVRDLKLPRYFAVFFNQNHSKPLSDKNVRLALNYATNKKAILEKILDGSGTVVDSPMLSGIIDIAGPATKYEFDLEKANRLLEEGGWKYTTETQNGNQVREKAPPSPPKKSAVSKTQTPPPEPTKLEIRITTSNWPELVSAANQLKTQWQAVGAKVAIEVLALPELQQAIKNREYEALLFGEVLGLDPDPFSFWHSSQKRDPGLNLALYDNKDADKILEDARQTLNRSTRMAKYADFQRIVVGEAPVVFLYSPNYLYAQPTKIKANGTKIIAVPSDRFDTITKWYIETKRTFRE